MLFRPRKHKEKSPKRGRKKKNSESSEVRLKIQIKMHNKCNDREISIFQLVPFFCHANKFVSL